MRNLLILGAGPESVEGYLRAKKLNCKIIAVDKNPKAASLKYADQYINASIHNYAEILKKVKTIKCKINGVIALGDVSFIVAKLSRYLKTESIPVESAKITSNKFLFKKKMEKYFNIPNFKKIISLAEIKNLVNKNNKRYVLKPVDNSGARGVILIDKFKKYFGFDTFNSFTDHD